MPPYAIAFMISQTLTKYLGTGPLYPKDGFEENRCRKSWWTNILFINNLVLQNTVVKYINIKCNFFEIRLIFSKFNQCLGNQSFVFEHFGLNN